MLQIKPTWIIILVLVLYSAFTTYKIISDKPQIVTNTVTIPGDIVYRDTIISKPVPYKVLVRDTVYIPKDSSKCVADFVSLWSKYSSERNYIDTLRNDTSMSIITETLVYNNAIQWQVLHSKNNRKTIINTTNVTYKNKLPMLSIGTMYDLKSIMPFGTLRINPNLYLIGGYNLNTKTPIMGLQYTILSK